MSKMKLDKYTDYGKRNTIIAVWYFCLVIVYVFVTIVSEFIASSWSMYHSTPHSVRVLQSWLFPGVDSNSEDGRRSDLHTIRTVILAMLTAKTIIHGYKARMYRFSQTYREQYYIVKVLLRRRNMYRWVDYALTHSCVTCLIVSVLFHQMSFSSFVAYWGCSLAVFLFGDISEYTKRRESILAAVSFCGFCLLHDIALIVDNPGNDPHRYSPDNVFVLVCIYVSYVGLGFVAIQELSKSIKERIRLRQHTNMKPTVRAPVESASMEQPRPAVDVEHNAGSIESRAEQLIQKINIAANTTYFETELYYDMISVLFSSILSIWFMV